MTTTITYAEAARLLGLSRQRVVQLRKAGRIRTVSVRVQRLDRADVERLAQERQGVTRLG